MPCTSYTTNAAIVNQRSNSSCIKSLWDGYKMSPIPDFYHQDELMQVQTGKTCHAVGDWFNNFLSGQVLYLFPFISSFFPYFPSLSWSTPDLIPLEGLLMVFSVFWGSKSANPAIQIHWHLTSIQLLKLSTKSNHACSREQPVWASWLRKLYRKEPSIGNSAASIAYLSSTRCMNAA